MPLHRVADRASNAPENIERAVEVIGRSKVRLAVFKAVHSGRAQTKTVDQLAKIVGGPRQSVLNAAKRLADEGLVHDERAGRTVVYRKDPFYQANRNKILRFVASPGSVLTVPTKRRPSVAVPSIQFLEVPVSRKRVNATQITVDDIQSFAKVRGIADVQPVQLSEGAVKDGLLAILGERGRFRDWGGERNDFLTDKLMFRGRRRVAAFALKGPGRQGILTPGKMGKNGDQLQRLASSPAQVLIVQYHGQVGEAVREQLGVFAQMKSVWEERPVWYAVIDGSDTARLVTAYPKEFAP